jgi:DNA-binding response OmpR family regulator
VVFKIDNYNILVVDDDKDIVESISIFLKNDGYNVEKAYDGLEAIDKISTKDIHLILMDVMMPKLDGLRTMMKLRKNKNIPIILVSAKSEDIDKIYGLTLGADDYITKPFNPLELLARVKSQLRRYVHLGNMEKNFSRISIGGLLIDTKSKIVSVDGDTIRLTPIEYKILEMLAMNPNRVYSAEEIYNKVWNEDNYVKDNTIAVHIRRIREKIEINPKEPNYLKVVWGIGYKIEKN